MVRHRSPSVLKKQRDHGGAGLSSPAGLSCDLGRLVAAFLTAIAMRMHEAHLAIREVAARSVLVPRGGRRENHARHQEAQPLGLAIPPYAFCSMMDNPIRPGCPRPCELTRRVVAHPAPWERKSRWDRKSVVPEVEPSRASRCAIPQGFSREATR